MSESNWNENDNGIAGLGDPDLNDSPPAGTVATSQADVGSSAAADTLASGVQQTVLGNDASPPPEDGAEQTPSGGDGNKPSGEKGDELSGGRAGSLGREDGGLLVQRASGRPRAPRQQFVAEPASRGGNADTLEKGTTGAGRGRGKAIDRWWTETGTCVEGCCCGVSSASEGWRWCCAQDA